MKIINLKQLKMQPIGTIYAPCDRYGFTKDTFKIISERYDNDIAYTIDCVPLFYESVLTEPNGYKPKLNVNFESEFCEIDTNGCDYDNKQLFLVYSIYEMKQLIEILQKALIELDGEKY